MDYKKIIEKAGGGEGFAKFSKTTVPPPVSDSDKAVLNRKGNILFNSGRIEEARRVFLTTGYSDGLSRVGDYYKSQGRELEALKMYWIAPDKRKAGQIIEKLAGVIKELIHTEGEKHDE